MPKYHPTFLISDCWSSIGGITFFHRNGQCFWRRKPTLSFPGTPAQLQQSSVHHRAILAWQQLDSGVQRQWREYAAAVPAHRPPYQKENHISGYNLFVSAYHGFAQLGCEHVPQPQAFPQFPAMSLDIVGSRVVGGTDLELQGRLVLSDTVTPQRWQLLARLQLTVPGGGYDSGKLRSFMASMGTVSLTGSCSTTMVTLTVPQYRQAFGLDCPACQAHIRYRLVDTVTGYRNDHVRHRCLWGIFCTPSFPTTFLQNSFNKIWAAP